VFEPGAPAVKTRKADTPQVSDRRQPRRPTRPRASHRYGYEVVSYERAIPKRGRRPNRIRHQYRACRQRDL